MKIIHFTLKYNQKPVVGEEHQQRREVKAANKQYELWQRDSLAFELTRRSTALQKLAYIHNNPLAAHWQLCKAPTDYYYSSANITKRK